MRFVKDGRHPVELVLRVLGIASSTFYCGANAWNSPRLGRSRTGRCRPRSSISIPAPAAPRSSPGVCDARPPRHLGRPQAGGASDAWCRVPGRFLRKRWRIASTRTDPRAAPAPDLVERSSLRIGRIGCGWPMRPGSRAVRVRSGWRQRGIRFPTGSWAGRPRTAATPSRCRGRSSSRSGAVTSVTVN